MMESSGTSGCGQAPTALRRIVVLVGHPTHVEGRSRLDYMSRPLSRLISQAAARLGMVAIVTHANGSESCIKAFRKGDAHFAIFTGHSRWTEEQIFALLEARQQHGGGFAITTGGLLEADRAEILRQIGVPVGDLTEIRNAIDEFLAAV